MTKEASRELSQEPQIVLREETDIRDIEQNHGEPVHAQAESVAAPFLGIVSFIAARFVNCFENSRVNYAAATDLDPFLAFLERF